MSKISEPVERATQTCRTSSRAGLVQEPRATPEFAALQAKADRSGRISALGDLQALADRSGRISALGDLQTLADRSDRGASLRELARGGLAGSGHALPHGEQIQRSFGERRLDHVKAHSDSRAATVSRSLGAQAYTFGHEIAFASATPTLHTAAHEAAHVIQQQAGLHPEGGVGKVGDALERHADAVADAVVKGESAKPLLDRMASPTASAGQSEAVQRKAVIGEPMKPAKPSKDKDAPRNEIINDDIPRRFKNDDELDRFARGEKLEVAGQLEDENDTWIRVDKFIVLGEQHSNQKAPAIINALGTTRYRYEGFAEYDSGRIANDEALPKHVKERDTERFAKLGIHKSLHAGVHAAEHADVKYARVIPDVELLATEQALGKGDHCVPAGTKFDDGYDVDHALLGAFLDALIYVRSYGGKTLGHTLKDVETTHRTAIRDSIELMQTALAQRQMPDLSRVRMASGTRVADLKKAFMKMARKRVGLKKDTSFTQFKNRLDPGARQAYTDEANEGDFLRDKSMLDTIDKTKRNNVLFIIGDAHRQKLEPRLEAKHIENMRDKDFIKWQQRMNSAANYAWVGLGWSSYNQVTELITKNGMTDRLQEECPVGSKQTYKNAIEWAQAGTQFTLPEIPEHFYWEADTGCEVDGNVLTRTREKSLALKLVFKYGDIHEFTWAL